VSNNNIQIQICRAREDVNAAIERLLLTYCRGMLVMTRQWPNDSSNQLEAFSSKGGKMVNIRVVEPRDREELQRYVRSLSARTRYSRFLGGLSELPTSELDRFIRIDNDSECTLVATTVVDGAETIVGEARYAFQLDTLNFEFGISTSDSSRRQGIGKALLKYLERLAASFGAVRIFGDTLRSNETIVGRANKYGYHPSRSPGDWRLVRYEKTLPRKE
jgi:GNAT superfamily N-acetyltransferase